MARIPRTWVAAVILFIAAWAVYRPALNRVFAEDQIAYFAELDGRTSLMAGLRYYDYGLTRHYEKGDDALFRPLLFAVLAVENTAFSYHHVWWNAANLALHGGVAVCLFQLLLAIRRSRVALFVALLFTVMRTPLEMVTLNHQSGYLLADLLFLIGLRVVVRRVRDADRQPRASETTVYLLAFTAASFCHEVMVAASGLAAIVMMWAEWRQGTRPRAGRGLVLFAPVLIYAACYIPHAARVSRIGFAGRSDLPTIFQFSHVIGAVPSTLKLMILWTLRVLVVSGRDYLTWPYDPLHAFNVAVLIATVAVLGWGCSRRHIARAWTVLALVAGVMFAYAGLIAFGRLPPNTGHSAYLYTCCLLLVVFAYALVDPERVKGRAAAATAVWLAVLLTAHTMATIKVARQIGRENQEMSDYLISVSQFVDAHRTDPGFRLVLAPQPDTRDPEIDLIEGYPDDPAAPIRSRRLTEILFARYFKDPSSR